MKKVNFLGTLITAVALAFAFTTAKIDYTVDKQQSKVSWLGKKVTGEHKGGISIASGKLTSDGKTVTGGSFDIDMTSITCTDLTDKTYNEKLIGHLKSDDFFSTEKFTKSTFVITSVTPTGNDQYKVVGNLTIKGITNPVEFPATIKTTATDVKANATIKVDRTKYGIKYGSGSFFDNLGDKAIDNEFTLTVDLVAKK
jgi:polyisoprenoid-binding protein YceI